MLVYVMQIIYRLRRGNTVKYAQVQIIVGNQEKHAIYETQDIAPDVFFFKLVLL